MVLMLMNLKNKENLIINEDMRYFMIDENYNPNAWENLSNALGNSEPYRVENSSNTELIFHLKSYINEMKDDDLSYSLADGVARVPSLGTIDLSVDSISWFINNPSSLANIVIV